MIKNALESNIGQAGGRVLLQRQWGMAARQEASLGGAPGWGTV